MKRKGLLVFLTLCLLSTSVTEAQAKWRWWPFGKKKNKTEKVDSLANKTEYEKLFSKKHTVAKGLITLHQLDGKVYFEMPISLLGKDMLIGSTVTSVSDNGNAIVGSKPTEPLLVRFTRNKTHVQLREINKDYIATESSVDQALANSNIGVVLVNKKISAYNKDSTAVVFDMTSFFVSDNKKMSPFDKNSAYTSSYKRTESYKSDCSYLVGVKAFEDNVSIRSSLSYTFSLSNAAGTEVLKDKPFTAEMTRSIMLLKDKPYRPRIADYRIGYFFTERMQLGNESATTRPVYYTNRWNLQPKDTLAYIEGKIVDVVKPIVFYVDNTFPAKWRPYIKEAVNQWSKVFEEECRLRGAVVAKDYPLEDSEFDPDNIKYNCIRYAPISIRNAMGPSWVDPRSGEILMASVYVYHDFIKLITNWLFVQTSQTDKSVRTMQIPEHIMGDAVRYVIGHEVGHCLGLMHNMGASNNVPVEKLRDPVYTQKYGTTPSIMDYARFNYVAQPGDKERGVKLTPPQFGVYDRYAIKWGYTPIYDKSEKEEESYMTQWITDSLKVSSLYRYGKQQFGMPFTDPRSMNEDLGDDAVKATTYGIKNLKYIVANMNEWLKTEDVTMEHRSSLLQEIVQQYALYAVHIASNISGYYANEVKEGDGQIRYASLNKNKQREAFNYLFTMYSDLEWMDNKELLSKIALSGSPKSTLRNFLQRFLFSAPIILSRYNNFAKNSLQPDEALDMLYHFVWKSTIAGKQLKDWERNLQKAYIHSYMENSGFQMLRNKKALTISPVLNNSARLCSWDNQDTRPIANPVAGFEMIPREIFNIQPSITQADMFVYVQKVKKLLRMRIGNAKGATKAHYELLLKEMANTIK